MTNERIDPPGATGLKRRADWRNVRTPYFPTTPMLAKLTSKNQLTLPKAVVEAVGGASEYFEVEAIDGAIVLRPVRIQRSDAVRAKLAELSLGEADVDAAVAWARARINEPAADYESDKPAGKRPGKPAAGKSRK
jgi:hypothetical protein